MSTVAGHDFVLDPAVSRRPANVSLQLPGLASTTASLDTVDTSSNEIQVAKHIFTIRYFHDKIFLDTMI